MVINQAQIKTQAALKIPKAPKLVQIAQEINHHSKIQTPIQQAKRIAFKDDKK